MPGIPLLNIGAALGGLSQGYNQAQNQGIAQALARLQLQQAQEQQNAQSLASLALQAGLLGNNNVQTNPLQGLPQPQSPQVAVSAPQINVPQNPAPQPPPAAQPQSTADLNTGFGDLNLNQLSDPRYQTGMPTEAEDYSSATTGLPSGGMVSQSAAAASQPPPAPTPPPPQQTAAAGGSDTSDTSSAPAPSGGQQVSAVFPNGQTIDMSSMFKSIDYGKLAQGIAQLAPPGTSQADIFNAVLDLGKLAEGDKVQQQQAGLLARALLGGNFKLAAINQQGQFAQQRVDTQQAAATGRTVLQQTGAGERQAAANQSREQIATANRESREKMTAASQDLRRQGLEIRNKNQQAALAMQQERLQIAMQQAGRQDAALQISAVRARIGTIKPDAAGNYSDAQQKQLQEYNNQIADIAAKAAGAAP